MEQENSLPGPSGSKTFATRGNTLSKGAIGVASSEGMFSTDAVKGLIHSDMAEFEARSSREKIPKRENTKRKISPGSSQEKRSKEMPTSKSDLPNFNVIQDTHLINMLQPPQFHMLLPPLWTDVLCMKVVDDYLYLGCSDGSIVTVDLITQDIINQCHAHDAPVIVLLYWRKCVIAASSNGSLSLVDLDLHIMKTFSTGASITCGDNDPFGLLFFGTLSGTIIKVNALAMSLINQTLKLEETKIDSIFYVDELQKKNVLFKLPLLFILAEQKAALREIESGSLLFTVLDPCSFGFYCPSDNCAFTFGIYVARFDLFVGSEATSKAIELLKPCTAAIYHKNNIFISDAGGKTYMLTKDLKNVMTTIAQLDASPISMLTSWKHSVIAYIPERRLLAIATPMF